MSRLPVAVEILLAAIVILAAGFDLRRRRVPNWLSLAGILLGLGLNGFLSGPAGLWMSGKGLGLAFLIYFPLYLLRGMGAGDVKLMTAVGAIAGPANWLRIFVFTLLFRGTAAVILVLSRKRGRRTFENIRAILAKIGSGKAPYVDHPQLDVRSGEGVALPHAVIIALGVLVFLAVSALRAPR